MPPPLIAGNSFGPPDQWLLLPLGHYTIGDWLVVLSARGVTLPRPTQANEVAWLSSESADVRAWAFDRLGRVGGG
jgi:hypothetical protein